MEALAATIVGNFLVPYVKLGAEALAKKIATSAGDAAGEHAVGIATQIWNRVRGAFGGDPGKAATLEQFEKNPEAFAPGVEALLTETLANDKKLAEELESLAEQAGPGDQTAVQIMADTVGYVDARGAVITGVVAGINYGETTQERIQEPPQGSGGARR